MRHLVLLLASLALAWSLLATSAAIAQPVLSCLGPPPIPPILPIGCREMVPQCVCTERNCWWIWVCAR